MRRYDNIQGENRVLPTAGPNSMFDERAVAQNRKSSPTAGDAFIAKEKGETGASQQSNRSKGKDAVNDESVGLQYLVAMDGSPASQAAFEYALTSSTPRDKILIFHDQQQFYTGGDFGSDITLSTDPRETDVTKHLSEFTDKRCKEAGRQCDLVVKGIVGGATAIGNDIAKFAQQRHADRIVMGARGLSGALGVHVAMGSVSTAVIQRADVPVTIIKDQPHQKGSRWFGRKDE